MLFSSRRFNEITLEASDSEPRKKLVKEDKIPVWIRAAN